MENNTIKQVTAKTMLGAIIDEKSTFKNHIKDICMQARKSYSQLAAFPNLPISTLKTLYKSFIRFIRILLFSLGTQTILA